MDRLLPWLRRSGSAYVLAAIALALAAWRIGSGGGGGQPDRPPEAPAAASVESAPAPGAVVHVAGAVRRPGVYRVPEGARVQAAVRKAGGPTADADLTLLNLAAPLQDGQQVIVPARVAPGAVGAGPTAVSTGPVSLSSATAEQLEALDGIGPALAARIAEWRTAHGGFASVDQLAEVPGIGPGRLAALRDRVVP
jgi:competence protein ComEA